MAGFGALIADSPLFKVYLYWGAILIVKMLAMAFFTARRRMRSNAYANPEDAVSHPGAKVVLDDPDVERVRRAHRNDLENVVPFLLLCPLYLATGPGVTLATNLIRMFAVARIAHTALYLNEVPVLRGVAWVVGLAVTLFMAGATIIYSC